MKSGLKWLSPYIRPYRGKVGLSIVFHIFSAIFTVVSIPLIKPFFDILFDQAKEKVVPPSGVWDVEAQLSLYFQNVIDTYDKQYALMTVCIAIAVIFFLKNLTRYLAAYHMISVRTSIVTDIRTSLFQKLLSLPLSFFTAEKKGNIITKLSSDVQEIEVSIIQAVEAAFKAPFILIGSLFFMLYISPQLSLFVGVLLLFVVVIIGGISRKLKKQSSEVQEKMSDIISQTEESIGGIKVIKAYQNEDKVVEIFRNKNIEWKTILNKILRRRDLSSPLSEFLGVSVVAVLMYYGSSLVFTNQLSPGSFFSFIFAFYQIIEPSKTMSNAYYHIQKGLASIDRIDEIHQVKNIIIENSGNQEIENIQEGFEFRNVSFEYPESDRKILNNISLEIKVKTSTALVGLSGAGKTTLADLIIRFYDPTAGEITLDGKNLKDYKLDSLRNNIGLVTQEIFLFHDTIAKNILFGNEMFSEEKIIEAAKLAHAHEFISLLPNGYQTIIGDQGVKLSGGQRQRLALARAILRNPSVIILDEATSALDSTSEVLVQQALVQFLKDKTSIIIAHRLSTVQNADNIIVMKDGQIIEQGTHQNLLQDQGEYANLVKLQMVKDS